MINFEVSIETCENFETSKLRKLKCLNFENKVSQEFQLFQCSPHWELYYKESINYNKLGRSSSQSQNSRVSAEDFHHLFNGIRKLRTLQLMLPGLPLHGAPCLILFYFIFTYFKLILAIYPLGIMGTNYKGMIFLACCTSKLPS
jgi:hypothetical protein